MKYFIILAFILYNIFPVSPLMIQEKIDIKRNISSIYSLLYQSRYESAKNETISLIKKYRDTEYNGILNYYLSEIYEKQNDHYRALYHIKISLDYLDDIRITSNMKSQFLFTAGQIYYNLGMYNESSAQLEEALIYDDHIKDRIFTYISMNYYRLDNFKKALFYFKRIKQQNLPLPDKKLYNYLANIVTWSQFNTIEIGYKDPNVSSIVADVDKIYIALYNGGLIIWSYILDEYRWIADNSLSSLEIRKLYLTERYLYIGTIKGVTIYDKRSDTFTKPEGLQDISVTSFTVDAGGMLYIGTLSHGLFTYNHQDKSIVKLDFRFARAVSCLFTHNDTIYISTYSGELISYNQSKFKKFFSLSSPNKPVTSMLYHNGELWMSTYGAGVFRYDFDNNRFSYYNEKNSSLVNPFCLSISKFNDNIYCSTLGDGIYFFKDKDTNKDKWHKLFISDLYLGNDIQDIVFHDNNLFIATLGEGLLIKQM